jgi:hypothetical protein
MERAKFRFDKGASVMKSEQYMRPGWLPLPLLFLAVCAQATEVIDPSVTLNPAINSGSVRLDGQLFMDTDGSISLGECAELPIDGCVVLPWIINVFAGDDECLRLDLIRPIPPSPLPSTDFQMIVIDPFGTVYQSGFRPDRPENDPRPLVKINTFEAGYYTVLVQRDFDETGPAHFTVRYGRYNDGNPNCANPTQPLLSQQAAAMGLTAEQAAAASREAMRKRRNR